VLVPVHQGIVALSLDDVDVHGLIIVVLRDGFPDPSSSFVVFRILSICGRNRDSGAQGSWRPRILRPAPSRHRR
jgi:hypothetical protein